MELDLELPNIPLDMIPLISDIVDFDALKPESFLQPEPESSEDDQSDLNTPKPVGDNSDLFSQSFRNLSIPSSRNMPVILKLREE